jgi:hypothetical protein
VSVTVTADASLLNTDNSNVATSLDAKEIVELPLNVRNVYGLTTLNSSVSNSSESQMLLGGGGNTTDNADQDISFLNFNGGYFGSTAFLLDGSWDTDPEWGAVVFVPSVDGVQEFKIQNNSFTAQYGWSTGNVVNVVTKGGTRNFHGSAYEFYTNNNTQRPELLCKPQPMHQVDNTNVCTLSRNQTGASAGGPLYIPHIYRQRDKTFIFGLYEHFTVSTPTVVVSTLCQTPTSAPATSPRFWADVDGNSRRPGPSHPAGPDLRSTQRPRDYRGSSGYFSLPPIPMEPGSRPRRNRVHSQPDPRQHSGQSCRLHPGSGGRKAVELLSLPNLYGNRQQLHGLRSRAGKFR